jgi:peptidoglycan hydrolase-like protein with peptidoglycan-binding domain
MSQNPINLNDKADVKFWQDYLKLNGFDCGSTDGIAGKKTQEKTCSYKNSVGLPPTFEIDDNTAQSVLSCKKLPILKINKSNKYVQIWKWYLTKNGFICETQDDTFDKSTFDQTVAYQKAKGLDTDGVVGQMTLATVPQFLQEATQTQETPKETPQEINMELSANAYQLILDYEVGGGMSYYNRFLIKPTIPGGSSGVTIGIGYDLGFNTVSVFNSDWENSGLDKTIIKRLEKYCGKSSASSSYLKEISDIRIPWECAQYVFNTLTIPKFKALTIKTFPGAFEKLSDDAFGALVSLVFNRGASVSGSSRINMLNIKNACKNLNGQELVNKIYTEIINMIPIWEGKSIYNGMKERRTAEAKLVKAGGAKKTV